MIRAYYVCFAFYAADKDLLFALLTTNVWKNRKKTCDFDRLDFDDYKFDFVKIWLR